MGFWEWLAVAVGSGVLGMGFVVAFRINLTLDVNQWVADRERRKRQRIRDLCPHVRITELPDGKIECECLLVSPAMSQAWVCRQCGATDNAGVVDPQDVMQHWLARTSQYHKRMQEYNRLTDPVRKRRFLPWN